jgi:hypothetical protein
MRYGRNTGSANGLFTGEFCSSIDVDWDRRIGLIVAAVFEPVRGVVDNCCAP